MLAVQTCTILASHIYPFLRISCVNLVDFTALRLEPLASSSLNVLADLNTYFVAVLVFYAFSWSDCFCTIPLSTLIRLYRFICAFACHFSKLTKRYYFILINMGFHASTSSLNGGSELSKNESWKRVDDNRSLTLQSLLSLDVLN